MRTTQTYIASVDQGTASSRCIVFDRSARNDLVSYVREAARAVSRDLGGIPW